MKYKPGKELIKEIYDNLNTNNVQFDKSIFKKDDYYRLTEIISNEIHDFFIDIANRIDSDDQLLTISKK